MGGEQAFIGTLFGNYRLIAELAKGLHSSIYAAQHVFLPKRTAAIKLMHTGRLNVAQQHELFLQEAQLLDVLKHPHILPLIDVGIEHDFPYLMTAYASNGSLHDYMERQLHRPLALDTALSLLSQIGDALQYAHEQHVVHCDLKPENILLHNQDEIWLADFGIARLLGDTEVAQAPGFGSLAYMAPEQIEGAVSSASDQYALGCIAYELVTGQQPFMAFSLRSLTQKHLIDNPVAPTILNPQLPAHVEAAILKAMAKQPAARFYDIRAFSAALVAAPSSYKVAPLQLSSLSEPQTEVAVTKTKDQWLADALALYNSRHVEDSLNAYENALALDPEDAYVYIGKGLALCDLERYDEALAQFEQALALDPEDAYAYIAKARLLGMIGKYQEALEIFDDAIQLDPNDVEAYLAKAMIFEQTQHYQDALLAYEDAIALDPISITAWKNKSIILERLGRKDDAREASNKLQQLLALADL